MVGADVLGCAPMLNKDFGAEEVGALDGAFVAELAGASVGLALSAPNDGKRLEVGLIEGAAAVEATVLAVVFPKVNALAAGVPAEDTDDC